MRGALFMAVSMAGFVTNDAITKDLAESMNFAQVMLVRGAFATILIAVLAWHRGAFSYSGPVMHPLMAVRIVGEIGGTLAFLTALAHMPLANISAVLQSLPLAVTMGAALVLSEPVGWRRWMAIVVGFVGVMVIVRPGLDGFDVYALYALLCVAFCAMRDLATRRLPSEIPSLLISTLTALAVGVCGGILVVPLGGWSPMGAFETFQLFAAALLMLLGYQFVIMAMRLGDISFVSPFRYTALIWAIVLGAVFFAEVPDTATLLGAALIVLSGVYTLYRERRRNKTRPAAESTSPSMAPDGT